MSEHNSLRDEVKEQQKRALKGKSLREKVSYILFYYKKHIIIGIIVACVVISTLNHVINQKKIALAVAMVNCNQDVDYEAEMLKYFDGTGLDDSYTVSVDPTYVMMNSRLDYQLEQKFFLATASGQIDVVMAPATFFDIYAAMGYMKNLTEIMSEDELAEYSDFIHEVRLDEEHGGNIEASGVEITNFSIIKAGEWFNYGDDPIYLGIPVESVNASQALDYLNYLKNGQNIMKK